MSFSGLGKSGADFEFAALMRSLLGGGGVKDGLQIYAGPCQGSTSSSTGCNDMVCPGRFNFVEEISEL